MPMILIDHLLESCEQYEDLYYDALSEVFIYRTDQVYMLYEYEPFLKNSVIQYIKDTYVIRLI